MRPSVWQMPSEWQGHCNMDKRILLEMLLAVPVTEIALQPMEGGYRVVSGHMRLKVLMSLRDEAVVIATGLGKMLVFKTPDGQLHATQDGSSVALFGN